MTLAALFSFGLVPGVAFSGSFFVSSGYCSLGDIVWSSFVSSSAAKTRLVTSDEIVTRLMGCCADSK